MRGKATRWDEQAKPALLHPHLQAADRCLEVRDRQEGREVGGVGRQYDEAEEAVRDVQHLPYRTTKARRRQPNSAAVRAVQTGICGAMDRRRTSACTDDRVRAASQNERQRGGGHRLWANSRRQVAMLCYDLLA